tara:strand:+ start:3008 stop:3220 length:213 start_codon:yes stop_codon:yes gene_type:complete
MKTKLQINKLPEETLPARRRRLANAILSILERDALLREEIGYQLEIDPEKLNYRGNPELVENDCDFVDVL